MVVLWCRQTVTRSLAHSVYGHVITKFSGMGRLPHFLSYGAPPMRVLCACVELHYNNTVLIQTLHSIPSVSVLERFDCNGFDSKKSISGNLTYFLTFKATELKYHKIPKIRSGAYIFQRPFWRGLFLEGLIFEGAYLWREICVSKSIGLAI